MKSMTKSFEEFDVHKKGIVQLQTVFQLLNNKSLKRNLVLKIKLKEL
jgi:hypothetical protein